VRADPGYRLVLASASVGRLETLRRAGLRPEVIVSGVDESADDRSSPAELVERLAVAKCRTVAAGVSTGSATIVIGCDSVLDLDGTALGKPANADDARRRWQSMRGRTGRLITGHCVRLLGRGEPLEVTAVATTQVRFADVSDAEIEAYLATGEPLGVAGAFTISGLGGAFVTDIEGDPHNVVGISLPLLREMLMRLGVPWPDLWRR